MTTMGLVHDYGGLLTVRWFLYVLIYNRRLCATRSLTEREADQTYSGLTEAGLFPGVNYFLSCWYDVATRPTIAEVF